MPIDFGFRRHRLGRFHVTRGCALRRPPQPSRRTSRPPSRGGQGRHRSVAVEGARPAALIFVGTGSFTDTRCHAGESGSIFTGPWLWISGLRRTDKSGGDLRLGLGGESGASSCGGASDSSFSVIRQARSIPYAIHLALVRAELEKRSWYMVCHFQRHVEAAADRLPKLNRRSRSRSMSDTSGRCSSVPTYLFRRLSACARGFFSPAMPNLFAREPPPDIFLREGQAPLSGPVAPRRLSGPGTSSHLRRRIPTRCGVASPLLCVRGCALLCIPSATSVLSNLLSPMPSLCLRYFRAPLFSRADVLPP